MKKSFQQLQNAISKESRFVLGLISGTSMDGLDAALCEIRGSGILTTIRVVNADTVPYPEELRNRLLKAAFRKETPVSEIVLLNSEAGHWISETVKKLIDKWKFPPAHLDLIASHGQTVYHEPSGDSNQPNVTLQIGEPDIIARKCGVPVIADFRQKHIAAGGEGAPVTAYGDWLLYSDFQKNRLLLNLGGIANITWIPAKAEFDQVMFGDTGPANTLIDALVRKHFKGKSYDQNGEIAASGNVNKALLDKLLSHDWFKLDFPKTTGPELFSEKMLESVMSGFSKDEITPEDAIATVTEFTAVTVTNGIKNVTKDKAFQMLVSGGGIHNAHIMKRIAELTGVKAQTSEFLGVDPDYKEAVLFAVLANETLLGDGFPAPDKTGKFSMGKISLP